MLLLIAVGAGIVFVAWSNTRRRNRNLLERREVEDSTGKLKNELERTASEIIGRMENHVTHLEKVLDESERNRTQLEGRVTELKKLLKKSEGQSGEIRDLLARLDDAGEEVNSMQRKMDVVERKLNLAITTPFPMQQPVTIPQMPSPLVTPIISPPPAPISSAPAAPITPPRAPISTTPATPITPPPTTPAPVTPPVNPKVTTTPAEPINPLGPITVPPIIRPAQKESDFDKILEESIAESSPEKTVRPPTRSSVVLSPENKQPVKVIEADPVKIEATRRRLTEASAEMAKISAQESEGGTRAKVSRKKRRTSDVRKAALEAIRAAEQSSASDAKPAEPPVKPPPTKEQLPERRDLKLETTDSSIIREMLLSGMSVEEISRETGLGRGAIELVQELTRRQLERR